MLLLSGLEKPEQSFKWKVKNSVRIDVHIIISKITTFYSDILQGDTSLFLAFIQLGGKYWVYTFFLYVIYALFFAHHRYELNN